MAASHPLSHGSVSAYQWSQLPPEQKRFVQNKFDASLDRACSSSEPVSELLRLGLLADAMAMEDFPAFQRALAAPFRPLPWIADERHGVGQRDVEADAGHPAATAVWLAACGDSHWLRAMLPTLSPLVRLKLLEVAAHHATVPETFEMIFESIEIHPEPSGGWPDHARLRSIRQASDAATRKEALMWAKARPFGAAAFEAAAFSGFASALRKMGQAVGPQPPEAGPGLNRLAPGDWMARCVANCEDPVPTLMEAMEHLHADDARSALEALRRAPGWPKGQSIPATEAVQARLEALDLRRDLSRELPRPGPSGSGPARV